MLSSFCIRRAPFSIAAVALTALAALAVFSAQAAQAALGDRTLRQGDRGKDVKALQKLLRRAGFPVRVDGVFGRGTYVSMRTVERELGLDVNGDVTKRDLRRIGPALRPSDGSGGFSADAESRQRASVADEEAEGATAELTEDGLASPPRTRRRSSRTSSRPATASPSSRTATRRARKVGGLWVRLLGIGVLCPPRW